MQRSSVRRCALWAFVLMMARAGLSADVDEFKVKRQEVFEFTEKPSVTREGDKVTIRFASKDYCDATVAIEDASGKIVRHLASGVLGANAPEPFQRNSLGQVLVWDCKDDQGQYAENVGSLTVRVSLGLKPRFERTLYWTPGKRITESHVPVIRACPEGVLVYEGRLYDSVRLYDHHGNYVRTVYPFPADKLASHKDLHWTTFPQDGARLPMKQWFRQATLLTSGDNSNHPFQGFGNERFAHDGHSANGQLQHAASAMAVFGDRIALAMLRLNRMATDGSSGGFSLEGSKVCFETDIGDYYGGKKNISVGPTSAAFSPDGKWLYLTGFTWSANWGSDKIQSYWLPGVVRMEFAGDAEPTVFVGAMDRKAEGKDDTRFTVPTSVACDAKGRVYVADYMNDRIQVYLPDGKFFKTIPVTRPAQVAVHQKSGEVYVFSWAVPSWRLRANRDEQVKARLTRLGPVEQPGAPTQYDLRLNNYDGRAGAFSSGQDYWAELDSWADEPTIWLYPGSYVRSTWGSEGFSFAYGGQANNRPYWQSAGIQLLTLRDGKLTVKRDFGEESTKAVGKSTPVAGTNRNLCVNPATGKLYVGEGSAYEGFSWSVSVEIDPQTGLCKLVDLPFDTEQMAFDLNGMAYLRAHGLFVRYEPTNWREVPWDYGEERTKVGSAASAASGPGMKRCPVASAVVVPQREHAPQGVFSISAKGRLVIPIKAKSHNIVLRERTGEKTVHSSKPYEFRLYPGRVVSGLVLVLDEHGRAVLDDAVPGLPYTHGVKIDKDDNLYAMVLANRVLDGKPYHNPAAGTLIKFKPKKARIVGDGKGVPVPMPPDEVPKRPPDVLGGNKGGLGKGWMEGAEWFYGGVGYNGEHYALPDFGCDCCFSSFDLDLFARSFAPEVDHCSVAALDSNGNLILRIGKYGNVDDGVPLEKQGGPAKTQAIGGDEVALFYAPHLAVHTDHRLFIADVGNERIVSVKLDYHATERVRLSDTTDKRGP